MIPPITLGTDHLANIHLLLSALVRETHAADTGTIGHHLSDALSRIQVAADGYSGLLAVALDLDEQDAAELAQERRAWVRRVVLVPDVNQGVAT